MKCICAYTYAFIYKLSIHSTNIRLYPCRDHVLHRWIKLMSKTPVAASMYEEQSFMRDPSLLQFLIQIINSLKDFKIELEASLVKGVSVWVACRKTATSTGYFRCWVAATSSRVISLQYSAATWCWFKSDPFHSHWVDVLLNAKNSLSWTPRNPGVERQEIVKLNAKKSRNWKPRNPGLEHREILDSHWSSDLGLQSDQRQLTSSQWNSKVQ